MSDLKEKMIKITEESVMTGDQFLFKELLEQITDEELSQVTTFRKLLSLYCFNCFYCPFFINSKLYTKEGWDNYSGYAKSAEKIILAGYSSDVDKELSSWLLDKSIMRYLASVISSYSFTKNYGFKFNVEIE